MHSASLVAAAVAAFLHAIFFVMESILFPRKAVWSLFARSEQDAAVLRGFAFNQGFYNLFLGIGAGVGVACVVSGNDTVGYTLIVFTCASMVGAALVLLATSRRYWAGALIQGGPPLVALAMLVRAI